MDEPEIPEGFAKVDAAVYRKGQELLVIGLLQPEGPFAISMRVGPPEEELGPPPAGYEWTGEVRPPRKGELFWSDLKGQVVAAIKDETGTNQFGEPTGGRKILRRAGVPAAPAAASPVRMSRGGDGASRPRTGNHLRLVKTTEE